MSSPLDTSLHWIDSAAAPGDGFTWGVPWPQGALRQDTAFALSSDTGASVPLQSWQLATWPDGSVKWSAHSARSDAPSSSFTLHPGRPPATPAHPVTVRELADALVVDTGAISARVPKSGTTVITDLRRDGRTVALDGRLLSSLSSHADGRDRRDFTAIVEGAVVERSGLVHASILVTGRHSDGDRAWLPFRLRLRFTAESDQITAVHSLIWDGDAESDFLCSLGIRFDVPLSAPLHDRHVRIAGSHGFLSEASRPITGLWKDPGTAAREAQIAGQRTPPVDEWDAAPSRSERPALEWERMLDHVPAWNDWTLSQLSADGYTLRKRTTAEHGWVTIPSGTRARGLVYLGQPDGGLEVGLRGFWQSHPTQIDVRDAAGPLGSLTVWLWSPEAQPMDVRFYHPGAHEQDPQGQRDTVEITYEDYKPGYGDAHGVGRTHELSIRILEGTPGHAELAAHARSNETPPQLACPPARLHQARVFGDWSPPDRSTPAAAAIEDRVDMITRYLADQVEQRRWYGFWDFGDVMHSYDRDRHTWRYDIGGYAWDNSELSTDLWLWLTFLRTGDSTAYRFAEAMTRHTGEVDVYHSGRFAGFGTRHNVQHWGCSCKQLRISNAYYRRFMYYLTADARIGELLDEVRIDDRTFLELDRHRAVGSRGPDRVSDPRALEVDLGIDYGAMLASWLTDWERTGSDAARRHIETTLTDIGGMAKGYFAGVAHYDLEAEHLVQRGDEVAVSHLSAVFGIVETISEVLDLLDLPEFEKTWLDYCRLYLGTPRQQRAETGADWSPALRQGHSRLLAWAARRLDDPELARRAWAEFLEGPGDRANFMRLDPDTAVLLVDGPEVLEVVEEIPAATTNDAAQFGLAAIQNLALIGEWLPPTIDALDDETSCDD